MSLYPPFSGFNKQWTPDAFRDENIQCSPNTLQWFPFNQNKQVAQNQFAPTYNPETTSFEKNWYQTVPLRHDTTYPAEFCPRDTIQEHLNRKGRILNAERQKRYRTSFTTFQLGRLEQEFQNDKYAVGMKRRRLAGELNLTEKQVKVWFQNRRMKYKRVCQRIHNRRMAVNKYWQ